VTKNDSNGVRPKLLCLAASLGFLGSVTLAALPAHAGFTRNIMITGYWPGTNEMIRPFSASATQNPGGWIGQDWEGRGYNIHSFFPEFPGQTGPNWGRGVGDFEVDYQDTVADWHRITDELKPVAIITFSRGNPGSSWEIETQHKLRERFRWAPDYSAPTIPDANAPIFQSLPINTVLNSSLPMDNIRSAVDAAGIIDDVYLDTVGFGGNFLSEFIGLHGVWYHSLNNSEDAEFRNYAAGHIHVGIDTPLDAAMQATQITLRELTEYLDTVIPAPGSVGVMAMGMLLAGRRRR
jgi:hypothetical protein